MLRADSSWFKPSRRRRWLIGFAFASLLLVGILLGLLVPHDRTTIEIGNGARLDLQEAAPEADQSAEPADSSVPRFVASEYHDTYTTLWLLDADDADGPRNRRNRLVDIPHADGWDIEAAVSPRGGVVAALTIPPSGWDPDSHASLLRIEPSGASEIARGLNLRGGLVWSEDGRRIVVGRDGALAVLDAVSGAELGSWMPDDGRHASRGFAPFQIAMRGDTLWAAMLESGGTYVTRLTLDAGTLRPNERTRISDAATREWALSPDAAKLAFTEQQGRQLSVRVLPMDREGDRWVADLRLGEDGIAAAEFTLHPQSASPVWRADGTLDVGSWQGVGAADAVDGFSLPIAWDTSGSWQARRDLDGAGPGAVTGERLVIAGPEGARSVAAEGLSFVGWWGS